MSDVGDAVLVQLRALIPSEPFSGARGKDTTHRTKLLQVTDGGDKLCALLGDLLAVRGELDAHGLDKLARRVAERAQALRVLRLRLARVSLDGRRVDARWVGAHLIWELVCCHLVRALLNAELEKGECLQKARQ